jgi:hypothetical protein
MARIAASEFKTHKTVEQWLEETTSVHIGCFLRKEPEVKIADDGLSFEIDGVHFYSRNPQHTFDVLQELYVKACGVEC